MYSYIHHIFCQRVEPVHVLQFVSAFIVGAAATAASSSAALPLLAYARNETKEQSREEEEV